MATLSPAIVLSHSDTTTTVALVVLVACTALALVAAVVSAVMAVYRKQTHRDDEYHRHSWV